MVDAEVVVVTGADEVVVDEVDEPEQAALEVFLGAAQLGGSDLARRELGELLGGEAQRLCEVLFARAEVQPELAGVGVLRAEAVDRIGEAAFLANLLEQPRGGGAAEDRVEHRGRETARVGA